MAASADDQRYQAAEFLGTCELVSVTGAAGKTGVLKPGRYRVQFLDVAGAAKVWCRQGAQASVVAAADAPSTPFDLALDPRPEFITIVRAAGLGKNDGNLTDGLSFLTDAGTCTAAVTRVSRGV